MFETNFLSIPAKLMNGIHLVIRNFSSIVRCKSNVIPAC